MQRAIDLLSLVLIAAAAAAFSAGVRALGQEHDVQALYWLVMGALLLRSATDVLRPLR